MGGKVSIGMPCYNHARYVGEAIQSVLDQTYRNIELVLIDNCSTDGTREIIREFEKKDNRIVAIYHEKNMGFIRSMNRGLEESTGDYIALTSSDDVWRPEKTEEQVRALEAHPNYDVAHSNADIIDGEGKKGGQTIQSMYRLDPKDADGDIYFAMTRKNLCCTSTVLFRKKCLKTCGSFDEKLQYAPDWWFFLQLAKKHRFRYMDKVLADYRIHSTNLTRSLDRVYGDYVVIHTRLAGEGVEPARHYMTAAFSAAILKRTDEARKLVKEAEKRGSLSLQEKAVASIINSTGGEAGSKLLLAINKGRHFLMGLTYRFGTR